MGPYFGYLGGPGRCSSPKKKCQSRRSTVCNLEACSHQFNAEAKLPGQMRMPRPQPSSEGRKVTPKVYTSGPEVSVRYFRPQSTIGPEGRHYLYTSCAKVGSISILQSPEPSAPLSAARLVEPHCVPERLARWMELLAKLTFEGLGNIQTHALKCFCKGSH